MDLSYEHNNQLYRVTTAKKDDKYYVTLNDTTYTLTATELKPGYLKLSLGDKTIKVIISEGHQERYVFLDGHVYHIKRVLHTTKRHDTRDEIRSPISGKVVKIHIRENTPVQKGDTLMIIEAMKMEYRITAPYTGIITKIYFKENDQIDMGVIPLEIKKQKKIKEEQ
jgi:3-methylcrotonyl-CoA carboxylase alpha subunit